MFPNIGKENLGKNAYGFRQRAIFCVLLLLIASVSSAQNSEALFDQRMKLPVTGNLPTQMLRMSESFLGLPYIASSLEGNPTETLVCKLDGLDCTTLVESAMALAIAKESDPTYQNYRNELTKIRYRNGAINGYASRLHYVLDWMYENEQNDRLTVITKEIGGVPFIKQINFMSNHANLYPSLNSTEVWNSIKKQEEKINQRKHYYIPKQDIAKMEPLLKNGDIIAFTSSVEGLDCNHMGVITKIGNRAYLLHASYTEKKVILSKIPLAEYTASVPKHTGILVARLSTLKSHE